MKLRRSTLATPASSFSKTYSSKTCRSTVCAVSTDLSSAAAVDRFDLARAWRLDSRVALRPETFGALAYHFGTRRLTFLKSPKLVELVNELGLHPTAQDACDAVGVQEHELPRYSQALRTLAATGFINAGPAS